MSLYGPSGKTYEEKGKLHAYDLMKKIWSDFKHETEIVERYGGKIPDEVKGQKIEQILRILETEADRTTSELQNQVSCDMGWDK